MSELWSTEIGEVKQTGYELRGQKVTDLMQGGDWLGVMSLTLLGRVLEAHERTLFSACLIASVDHGMAPPSAHVTRMIASCGKPVADSVAGGLLTLGPRHGNAASAASVWLRTQVAEGVSIQEVVQKSVDEKVRLSGFGHAEYERDPRAIVLSELVKTTLSSHPHVDYALAVADELTMRKGKSLYLNIDGAIGAVLADLNWPAELADVLFLISRTVGLSAHALEEARTAKSYRRVGKNM